MNRGALALVALAVTGASAGRSQTAVHGTVQDAETGAPLWGVLITSLASGRSTSSDRLGRFVISLPRFPDTLRFAQIGRDVIRWPLAASPGEPMVVRLRAGAVTLSDVIVAAASEATRPLEEVGRWRVPTAAARGLPAAIEPDVFRSLVFVPAVSFSTPLSARPIVRGYDPGESSTRIDGFEVMNLYHIARAFSAFPAAAASQVSVATAPQDAAMGETTAGIVDVIGQTGQPGTHGGLDLSLASATGWVGGGGDVLRSFVAGRAVHLSVLDVAGGDRIPYDFQDVYAAVLLSKRGRPLARVTAFASQDNFADRDLGSGMDWGNVLLGLRWQPLDTENRTLNVWASANRFSENVVNIRARYSRLDVRNVFERLSFGADASVLAGGAKVRIGVAVGEREIGNRISPLSGDDFTPTDADFQLLELGTYADAALTIGRSTVQGGLRLDMAAGTRVLEPRFRIAVPISSGVTLGAAIGRSSRLYHVVSDPQSEPDVAFYDFWLNAGQNGVPVPTIDHGSVDLDLGDGRILGRLSMFASHGRGLVELRPSTDQRLEQSGPFRSGESRTAGIEIQVGLHGTNPRDGTLSATYVLSWSQRDWGGAWIPWSQDRRHLLRVVARKQIGGHVALSGAFEALSGPPLTPVNGVVLVGTPDAFVRHPAYVYGEENTARSAGTARGDVAASYTFTGPWKTRMALGLSVINAGFGPVAPLRPVAPDFTPGTSPLEGQVRYERLFNLPAIPTITLRAEF